MFCRRKQHFGRILVVCLRRFWWSLLFLSVVGLGFWGYGRRFGCFCCSFFWFIWVGFMICGVFLRGSFAFSAKVLGEKEEPTLTGV